jgi:hypothetical protein
MQLRLMVMVMAVRGIVRGRRVDADPTGVLSGDRVAMTAGR